jgi:hypothetical protein
MNKDTQGGTTKIDPKAKDAGISSADEPTKTGKDELKEEDLKKIAGGGGIRVL